jgi:predicted GNAT superfamily acetyltransferase
VRNQPAASGGITIRDCTTLEEYRTCVALQRAVWGWQDEDLIPTRFFIVAHKIEGQVLGAFNASNELVGFCLAVPALRGEAVYLHSHMLAVLPEYRRAGIGQRLKLEQRRQALARWIRLVEWTFDPLEWKNALFNLNRLGAIARRYVPNQYGVSSSPLHRGLPTDRLIAEWHLDSPRVVACIAPSEAAPDRGRAGPATEAQQRITLPLDLLENPPQQGASIAELQASLRAQFQDAFARGLAATGFEAKGSSGSYLLSVWDAIQPPPRTRSS